MSGPEDQETPGAVPNPTSTGAASPGLPGLSGADPSGSTPAPGDLPVMGPLTDGSAPAAAAPGSPPPEGAWFDHYMAGITGQGQGVPMAQNLAQLMIPPGMTMAGGGHFRIDPELAPQAIADLRHAAQLLMDEMRSAEDLANYSPPALDAVSTDAERVISYAAMGDHGSLRTALLEGAAEFHRQADKLEADLKAYLQVDEVNVVAPRGIEL